MTPSRVWLHPGSDPASSPACAGMIRALREALPSALAAARGERTTPLPGDDFEPAFVEAETLMLVARIDGRPDLAEAALPLFDRLFGRSQRSDLGRAQQVLQAAVLVDLARGLWPAEAFAARAARAIELIHSIEAHTSRDNPDNPFNNWWAVTHGAAGAAALTLLDLDPASLGPVLAREQERVRSYLGNLGDAGWYYEGVGYGFYAFTYWGAFLLACRIHGVDLAATHPGVARWPVLVRSTCLCAPEEDPVRGRAADFRVFWNDEEGNIPVRAVAGMLLAVASPEDQPALARDYLPLATDPKATLWERYPHRTLLLTFLPPVERAMAGREARSLPTVIHDHRGGFVALRPRYRDRTDPVVCLYGRAYHGGGHDHEDAGSLRLAALGRSWLKSGGQAKHGGEFQNVPLCEGRQRPRGLPGTQSLGRVSFVTHDDAGNGAVTVDLTGAYQVKQLIRMAAARFDPDGPVPVRLAVADKLWGDQPLRWAFGVCTDPELAFEPLPSANGFLLVDPATGAAMRAVFARPAGLTWTCRISKGTARTFSNGTRVDYPGVPLIQAETTAEKTWFIGLFEVWRSRDDALAAPGPETEGEGVHTRLRVGPATVCIEKSRWYDGPVRLEVQPGG